MSPGRGRPPSGSGPPSRRALRDGPLSGRIDYNLSVVVRRAHCHLVCELRPWLRRGSFRTWLRIAHFTLDGLMRSPCYLARRLSTVGHGRVSAARLVASPLGRPRNLTMSPLAGLDKRSASQPPSNSINGSISLSPLYPNSTIDLHVRTASSLHQSFLWLHPIQA